MRLTTRSEYAILALTYLARAKGRTVSVAEMASAQEIPEKFLEQLIAVLKKKKIVLSVKGRGGGYTLGRTPEALSLAEIVRLFDGPLAPTESVSKFYYRATPVEREKKLLSVLRRVRNTVAEIMEHTTLADVL